MTTKIEYASNTTDVRVCYQHNRAISTITKQPDGKYRVVKLYDGYVQDFDRYTDAREVAVTASQTKQSVPRNVKKIA